MAPNTVRFEITDGPRKFDLMIALFDKGTRSIRFEFEVLDDVHRDRFSTTIYWVDVSIQSVRRKDRRADLKWDLFGQIERSNCELLRTWERGHNIFIALYSTQTCKGAMTRSGIRNPKRR